MKLFKRKQRTFWEECKWWWNAFLNTSIAIGILIIVLIGLDIAGIHPMEIIGGGWGQF